MTNSVSAVTIHGVGYVNDGEAMRCELQITRDVEVVTSRGPKADPKWSMTDAAGHFHAYAEGEPGSHYPTLNRQTRHVDCDGVHLDPAMDDGEWRDEGCEGWDETYWLCRICGEEIKPGTIPGPHTTTIEGPMRWRAKLTDDSLTSPRLDIDSLVSLRVETEGVTRGERGGEWFGTAVVVGLTFDSMRGATYSVEGMELGTRMR